MLASAHPVFYLCSRSVRLEALVSAQATAYSLDRTSIIYLQISILLQDFLDVLSTSFKALSSAIVSAPNFIVIPFIFLFATSSSVKNYQIFLCCFSRSRLFILFLIINILLHIVQTITQWSFLPYLHLSVQLVCKHKKKIHS